MKNIAEEILYDLYMKIDFEEKQVGIILFLN